MGSVKDLKVLKEATQDQTGSGEFIFTDAYSAFDWGKMPDSIPNKGASLCLISAFFFEKLEQEGIKTHYEGLVNDENKIVRFSDLQKPTNKMRIKTYNVPGITLENEKYDYSKYKDLKGNWVIPIEFIYRNALPEGSSVFKRLKRGDITAEELGLSEEPKPGQRLSKSIIDLSTKLESYDRYWKKDEILSHGFISETELNQMKETVLKINIVITQVLSTKNISNDDGKVELAYDGDRTLVLIDTVATPDENRFTFKGTQLSKEIIRKYYRTTDWYKKTEEAKQKDPTKWKAHVEAPPLLPDEFKAKVAEMYQILCNDITGRKLFATGNTLEQLVNQL